MFVPVIDDLCHELPFSTISDDLLQSALHSSLQFYYETTNFENLEFNPFLLDGGKYNKDIEVNEFFLHNRFNVVPKSRYIFPDNPPLLSNRALTI